MPKGSRVLMADDDKMLVDMYKERLELAGYNVTVCRNGEEALARVRELKPDIALLDIMMPKVNGYETLASIKSDPETKDIPVIMLSALMRDFNREKAVEAGADDYLIKSEAMPADVITKIEQVLQKYGKGATPVPGSVPPNIEAPSAAPPVTATPIVQHAAPVQPAEKPEIPQEHPEVVQLASSLENKPKEEHSQNDNQIIFEPARGEPVLQSHDFSKAEPLIETHPIGISHNFGVHAPVDKVTPKEFEKEEAPVVATIKPSIGNNVPIATASIANETASLPKESAPLYLIVILTILVTSLLNFLVYFFFFFKSGQ